MSDSWFNAGNALKNALVRQAEAGECGLACVTMIARYHGDRSDLSAMRRRFPLSSRGSSLKDLITISDQLGFHSRGIKSDLESLEQLALPAILHWDLNHYVVLARVRRGRSGLRYTVLDPGGGLKILTQKELSAHFTGIALEMMPTTQFLPNREVIKLKLGQLWSRISGIWAALGRVLTLSIIIQIITLVVPIYMQLVIDTVLPSMDVDLLNVLAVGFAGLTIMSAITSWVRARMIIGLSNSLALQTAVNLFRHTIFLPSGWFEKRHLGDIVSRFGSLQPITDLLTKGLVGSIVDGAFAITTFVLMMIYSPTLTALTVMILMIYGLVKVTFYKSMKYANANVLNAQAVENTAFIENIRGISAIKIFCQEGNRQRLWQNKRTDVVNGTVKLGRITAGFDTINSFVVAIESIIFIYIAIRMVMDGSFSIGMIFAYQAYKQSFVGAIIRLIDQTFNFKLLDVHLERISDIALERREPDTASNGAPPFKEIEIQNLNFSYGFGLPLVLKGLNMKIEPGRTTAIVGPSGSGKTTLLKILCGLLDATSGRILVDGVQMQLHGVRQYRNRLGVVSQDDTLFAGSLAENIAFFDPDYDIHWVQECCRLASIHDDIMKMPMKYETMVGDMGSNLSGGQKQRVLLARALYKKPDVLIMDEGTSHLDIVNEARVIEALKALALTRILVAHRPETINMADTVIRIAEGQAVVERCSENNAIPEDEDHIAQLVV